MVQQHHRMAFVHFKGGKRMKKRLVAMLLALSMCAGMIEIPAFAAETEDPGTDEIVSESGAACAAEGSAYTYDAPLNDTTLAVGESVDFDPNVNYYQGEEWAGLTAATSVALSSDSPTGVISLAYDEDSAQWHVEALKEGTVTIVISYTDVDGNACNFTPTITVTAAATCTDGHTLTATAAVEATCTEAGSTAYWTCSVCGKYFSDEACTEEIEEDSWIIAALGHSFTNYVSNGDGTETASCDNGCGESDTRESEYLDCGTFGDNITWTLDNDYVLVLSGTGDMTPLTGSTYNKSPWYSYRTSITVVVLSDGVTSIGDYAFYRFLPGIQCWRSICRCFSGNVSSTRESYAAGVCIPHAHRSSLQIS